MKRRWVILYDGDQTHPWIARPTTGHECFFVSPDSLVRFLVDGGLEPLAVSEVIRTLKSGGSTAVNLEDLQF